MYKDLVHCPRPVDLDLREADHIVALPTHMSEPVLYIELGALLLKMRHRGQAILLLKENYDRIRRYKITGWNAVGFNDIMLGPASFELWFTNHRTFQALGDLFHQNFNNFMASEMYSIASTLIGKYVPYGSSERTIDVDHFCN